jgi:hypothetical protein
MIENVSFIYDHNPGHTVLGYRIVTLGLFTAHGFYPLDFTYSFSSKRHPESCPENTGDPKKSSGKRSFEAKHYTKSDPALIMLHLFMFFMLSVFLDKIAVTSGYQYFFRTLPLALNYHVTSAEPVWVVVIL